MTDLVIFSDEREYIPNGDIQAYLKHCNLYAKEHQVFLVPHRLIIDNILYLCLFDPNGSIIGLQGALHRNSKTQTNLDLYSKLNILQTRIGNIFLCVDTDIYYPELLRYAKLKGADLIISSQYIPKNELKPKLITTGMWNAAQQNEIYVVNCTNLYSAISAPIEITSDKTGFLVQPDESGKISFKLNFSKLQDIAAKGMSAEKCNPNFCKKYAELLGKS